MDMDLLSKTKTIIKCLLISSPKLMTIQDLDYFYIKSEGHQIPFSRLGYSNLIIFLHSIPDVLTIDSKTGEIVPVTSNTRSEHIHRFVTSSKKTESESNEWNISHVGYQRHHPKIKLDYSSWNMKDEDGLWKKMILMKLKPPSHEINETHSIVDDIPKPLEIAKNDATTISVHKELEEVKETTKVNDISDHGQVEQTTSNDASGVFDELKISVDKVSEEANEIAKDISILGDVEIEQPKVSDHGVGDEEKQDKLLVIPDAIPNLDDDDPIHSIGTPNPDIDAKITCSTLNDLQPRLTYDVFITEIDRPWRFWFRLCDKEAMDTVENQLMWHHEGKNIVMNPSAMIVGNACIVCHNDKWLRAEFIEKPVNDTIKVCFVDYGTIDVVSTSQCHYISKYFSAIPKCCYPGALESIDPIDNSDIELALVQSFCELIRNKPLAGLVTEVDRKNQIVRMVLIDTSEDVIINRKLLAVCKSSK